MVYDGNNYAMHHSALFYVCFIAAMITATVLMLGLFLLMVGRASQATRGGATADAEAAGPERPALDEAPAEPPATEPASAGPVPAVSAGATPHAA
jgi:hypothetical protein